MLKQGARAPQSFTSLTVFFKDPCFITLNSVVQKSAETTQTNKTNGDKNVSQEPHQPSERAWERGILFKLPLFTLLCPCQFLWSNGLELERAPESSAGLIKTPVAGKLVPKFLNEQV